MLVPRRILAEWVGVFMEESNILWGELIGGTLIVGCSIALVSSLWRTLEEIELFPFLILSAVTSALFSAGFYTLHHWKLESTSRGLLLIGTLLVPLDFLVLAGLTPADGAGLLYYAAGGAALAALGWLLYRSSHILIQAPLDVPVPSALLVTLAMLTSAGAQLLAPGWLERAEGRHAFLYLLSLVPALAQVGALAWILRGLHGVETWSVGRLVGLLIALGSVTFACRVTLGFPLGFPLGFIGPIAEVLPVLSPALTLVGVPLLLAGVLTYQKIAAATDSGDDSGGLWRTVGTALALTGLFVMFGGFVVAIENPVHRWVSGAINVVVLLAAAWILRVPVLHVPAQVYLAVLIVVGGAFDAEAMIRTPTAALRLTGLLALQALIAEWMIFRHRPVDARWYAVGGAVSTALALLLTFPFAWDHAGTTASVFGVAAFTWYAANLRWRFGEITYGCSLVLAAALFFACRYAFEFSFAEQVLWSLLTHATICLVANVASRWSPRPWLQDCFCIPLGFASLFATFFVAGVIGFEQVHGTLSWTMSAIATGWRRCG
ncbi:MAG: hypothetical protein EXR98_06005 [Gemmataceae bacterium]|nr:hypothetical protein [Gemmataceae bacterium]